MYVARHEITIPINKSSNDSRIVGADGYIYVPTISEKLHFGINCKFGVGWDDSLYPKNKKIVKNEICLYANGPYSEYTTIAKFTEFGEGSAMPSVSPSDFGIANFKSGWNYITIPEPKTNSIVFGHNYSGNPVLFQHTTFNSHRASSNKPYLRVTYDDIPPENPTSLYPDGITLNPRDVIRFAWEHNSKENNQQKGFTLQYSTNGGSTWTTVNQTTSNQFYDMPANTLRTSGGVLWRVRTTDGNDEVSGYTSASFELGVVPQKAPIPIAPISQYIDQNKPIRFEWSFTGGSPNEKQSKFDLQYSTTGGSIWITKTVATENTFYELPAGTFSGGNVTWRVRTYNNWEEVSPWSESKSFTIIGSPPIPLISDITNSARPVITWQSQGQHLYEIQILKGEEVIYETGSIPSTSDRNYKIKEYLQDGTYKAKLRIMNEYNLYSPWAEKTFTISTVKPQKPTMTIYNGEYGVTIKTNDTSLKTLVYRNSEYIGEVKNNHFIDYTGENNKEYKYFVRTINSGESFSDSDIKLGKCKFSGNTLALANNPSNFVKLKYGFGNSPKKSDRVGNVGGLVYYDGREYPMPEFSEFKSREKTVTFTLRTKEELEQLISLIDKKETLLYRDVDGDNIYGTIFNIDYERNIFGYYEVGFTIVKTDYQGVLYD